MSGTLQRGVALAAALVLLGRARVDGPAAGRPVPGDRVLRPDRRPVPGLRRPHPRHPGRRPSPTCAPWATGCAWRCSSTRTTTSRPTPTPSSSRPSLVSRPLRAVRPGLRRRPDDGGRRRGARWTGRRPRSSSTRSTARSTSSSAALGPTGANENGALSDLIDVGAANLDGNGEALNRTLTGFSQAVETLADNREDLFSSVDNLQTFTTRAGHDRRPGRPVQRQHGGGDRPARRRAAGPGGGDHAAVLGAAATSPRSSGPTATC